MDFKRTELVVKNVIIHAAHAMVQFLQIVLFVQFTYQPKESIKQVSVFALMDFLMINLIKNVNNANPLV